MGFSREECWSGLPFSTPGDLLHPRVKPASLVSPALAGKFFSTGTPGKPYASHTSLIFSPFIMLFQFLYNVVFTFKVNSFFL